MVYLTIACRAMLFAVFVAAFAGKVRGRRAFADFRRSVAEFRVLPPSWSGWAARATIAGEAGVLLLLALPWTVPAGFALAAGLLGAFTAAVALALRRGRTASCQCFGASAAPLSATHLVRNLALLAVCLTGLVGGAFPAAAASGRPAGLALALSAGAAAALFAVRLDDVVALLAPPAATGHPSAPRRR